MGLPHLHKPMIVDVFNGPAVIFGLFSGLLLWNIYWGVRKP